MREHWLLIGLYGVVISVSVLASMAIALLFLGLGAEDAVTVSFLTLSFVQMWHVFNMRDDSSRWLKNEITGNPWIWMALLVCLILLGAALYLPPLASLLSLSPPDSAGWLLIIVASCVPIVLGPPVKRLALWLSK